MTSKPTITLEGFTPEQLLSLPREELDALVLTATPVVFQAGTATLLGQFKRTEDCLVIELGHIDGGGEGVLPILWSFVERYAKERNVERVEWIVHAVTCDPPNPRLRRILERRGFVVKDMANIGQVYYYLNTVTN